MEPIFFATPGDWRKWLAEHHDRRQELLVGYYKKDSGKPSITWPESVDHALCFGWIDGVRRRIDGQSYCIRFTPRKTASVWSAINIERVKELTAAGLMSSAGLRAFEARKEDRSRIYSFEQANIEFEPDEERRFRRNSTAWKFFQAQAPWYRRAATWWVISAKREETKAKRLAALMADSEQGRTVTHLTRADLTRNGREP